MNHTARKAKPSRKPRIGVVVKRKNARSSRSDAAEAGVVTPANDTGFVKDSELGIDELGVEASTLVSADEGTEELAATGGVALESEGESGGGEGDEEVALADEDTEVDADGDDEPEDAAS